jgi:hypothetical protein
MDNVENFTRSRTEYSNISDQITVFYDVRAEFMWSQKTRVLDSASEAQRRRERWASTLLFFLAHQTSINSSEPIPQDKNGPVYSVSGKTRDQTLRPC